MLAKNVEANFSQWLILNADSGSSFVPILGDVLFVHSFVYRVYIYRTVFSYKDIYKI